MPRYIRNRDKKSCVAVALVNALKWLGYPATQRDVASFNRLLRRDDTGVVQWRIVVAACLLPSSRTSNSFACMNRHLMAGNALLCRVGWNRVNGHVFLIVGSYGQWWHIVGLDGGGDYWGTKRSVYKFLRSRQSLTVRVIERLED